MTRQVKSLSCISLHISATCNLEEEDHTHNHNPPTALPLNLCSEHVLSASGLNGVYHSIELNEMQPNVKPKQDPAYSASQITLKTTVSYKYPHGILFPVDL